MNEQKILGIPLVTREMLPGMQRKDQILNKSRKPIQVLPTAICGPQFRRVRIFVLRIVGTEKSKDEQRDTRQNKEGL